MMKWNQASIGTLRLEYWIWASICKIAFNCSRCCKYNGWLWMTRTMVIWWRWWWCLLWLGWNLSALQQLKIRVPRSRQPQFRGSKSKSFQSNVQSVRWMELAYGCLFFCVPQAKILVKAGWNLSSCERCASLSFSEMLIKVVQFSSKVRCLDFCSCLRYFQPADGHS